MREIGPDVFLTLQDLLIESIRNDTAIWQITIQDSEEKYSFDKGFTFFNAFAFYRLSFLDIVILFRCFLTAKSNIEKQVFTKILALNFYEFLDDLPAIFGKDFTNVLKAMTRGELTKDLIEIKRNIQAIKKQTHDFLREIRNLLGGHKDHDTMKQLKVIESFKDGKIELSAMAIYLLFLMIDKFEKKIIHIVKAKLAGS